MWVGRVIRFTKQMFPVYPNMVAVFLGFTLNFLMISKIFIRSEARTQDLLTGGIGLLLFVYLLRAFDEIKDLPTDKINFPDRPLVSGVVSLKDVHLLILSVIGLLLVLHLPYLGLPAFTAFIIVLVFSLLLFKWLFMEKYIRPSLPLALLTHNPIVYFYQYYIASFFGPLDSLPVGAILFLIGEGLGGTAWEISRKIRGSTQEDTYTTYSKIWGRKFPQALVAFILIASWALTFASVKDLVGNPQVLGAWLLPLAVIMTFIVASVKFAFKSDVAPPFRQYVEAYKMALFIAMIVAIIWG